MTILTTILISLFVSILVSIIIYLIMATDEDIINDKFSKLWSRVQKNESKLDRLAREMDRQIESAMSDIYETRQVFTSITGYAHMDKNSKTNDIIAEHKDGSLDLILLDTIPATIIPLKEKKLTKDSGMATIKFEGRVYEYKKPVSTEF